MVEKSLIDVGLTGYYPVVVLSDGNNDVMITSKDYTNFRLGRGMSDNEIMKVAGV